MDKTDHPSGTDEQTHVATALRALASAAIFGTIGYHLGKWLGTRGNAPGSEMASPMMKWSMSGFWGLLAAYCTLKASEHKEHDADTRFSSVAVDGSFAHNVEERSGANKTPALQIQSGEVVHEGEIRQSEELKRV